MRITAAEKTATRERLLRVAVDLFSQQGFDATTTRDIARAAGVAAGTLFNYFANKEELVVALADEACALARADFASRELPADLNEALFALIAAELRRLQPLRRFLQPLLETSFSLLTAARQPATAGEALRLAHLETVVRIARERGVADLPPVAVQLYWTLYTGVLAFWTRDASPHQEDTLALLDESLAMYTAWLTAETSGAETPSGADHGAHRF